MVVVYVALVVFHKEAQRMKTKNKSISSEIHTCV